MVNLYDQNTNQKLGTITEEQLHYLQDQLEEESLEDRDYSITRMTVDFFEGQGADQDLVGLLRQVLAGREEVIVRWSRR